MANTHGQCRYYLDERLEMPMVRAGGLGVMRTPHQQSQHTHKDFEFLYVMSGEIGWSLGDGSTFHLSGGDMSFVQPNTLHGWELNVVSPASFFWMALDPAAADVLRHCPISQTQYRSFANDLELAGNIALLGDHRMNGLFKETRRVLADCGDAEAVTSMAWLRSIIGQWILLIHESLRRRANRSESPEITSAMLYIKHHFGDVVTLQQVADQVGLSQSWLAERFAREVGLTPIDYLNRVRCKEARYLLENTSLSIIDIALQVGFSSSQYFSTSFKKYLGMSPSEYRVRAHQEQLDEA